MTCRSSKVKSTLYIKCGNGNTSLYKEKDTITRYMTYIWSRKFHYRKHVEIYTNLNTNKSILYVFMTKIHSSSEVPTRDESTYRYSCRYFIQWWTGVLVSLYMDPVEFKDSHETVQCARSLTFPKNFSFQTGSLTSSSGTTATHGHSKPVQLPTFVSITSVFTQVLQQTQGP